MRLPVCHCGESGFYHCTELRTYVDELQNVIDLILQADALREHAYERGDDDASIAELCRHVMKWPEGGEEP